MNSFWSRVNKSIKCWEWIGHRDSKGYGKFHFKNKPESAHRVSFLIHNGIIPKGLYVLHKCDNRACVKPDHLYLGTQTDNMRDMYAKGRGPHQSKTHCLRGHSFSGYNLMINTKGHRVCRTCAYTRHKAYLAANRLPR